MNRAKRTGIAFFAICVLLRAGVPIADEVTLQQRKADGPIVYYDMMALHRLDLGDPVKDLFGLPVGKHALAEPEKRGE